MPSNHRSLTPVSVQKTKMPANILIQIKPC